MAGSRIADATGGAGEWGSRFAEAAFQAVGADWGNRSSLRPALPLGTIVHSEQLPTSPYGTKKAGPGSMPVRLWLSVRREGSASGGAS